MASAAIATTETAAPLASRSPRSGIDTSPTPAASATPPAATVSAARGIDGQRDTCDEHGDERHHDEAGHQHRLPEPRPGSVRSPHEHDDAPCGEPDDHRAPAERTADAEADVVQGERAGAIRGVGAIHHRGGEEEERLESCERHRRDRESKLDLAPRDHERDDLRGQRARRNRMGQRQERGADRVHHPPHHVAAVDRAREERVERSIAASASASGPTVRESITAPSEDASTRDAAAPA